MFSKESANEIIIVDKTLTNGHKKGKKRALYQVFFVFLPSRHPTPTQQPHLSGKEKSIGGEVSRRQTKGNDTHEEATLDSVQDLNFRLGIETKVQL